MKPNGEEDKRISNIFKKEDVEKQRSVYEEICLNHEVLANNILRFDEIQALLSFEDSIPNNTRGLFWHEVDDFFAIFKRHKKQAMSLSKIQKEAKRRKTQKNSSVIKKHVEDEKYIFLMIHLINKGDDFNYKEACEKFGMSEEQMDEAVSYLLNENYISLSEGVVRDKLKQMVQITKISDIDVEETDGIEVEFKQETKYVPQNFGKTFQGY